MQTLAQFDWLINKCGSLGCLAYRRSIVAGHIHATLLDVDRIGCAVKPNADLVSAKRIDLSFALFHGQRNCSPT